MKSTSSSPIHALDCRYLPKGHYSEASSVCDAISNNAKELNSAVSQARLNAQIQSLE